MSTKELSYEYWINEVHDFTALYMYMNSNIDKLSRHIFENCPIILSTIRDGNELEYQFAYKGYIFLRVFHNSSTSTVRDECYAYYSKGDNMMFETFLHSTESFIMYYNHTAANEGKEIPLLCSENLTEEMYNQLFFLYPEEEVFCTFFISYLISTGLECSYNPSTNIKPKLILKELKEYLNDLPE